eukprot:scaffold2325_cov257-Pinguiococcus_pyrenoidosus.AAC.5
MRSSRSAQLSRRAAFVLDAGRAAHRRTSNPPRLFHIDAVVLQYHALGSKVVRQHVFAFEGALLDGQNG